MGYPFFNPPTIQKINKVEEGNFFVPTQGVMPESVTQEISPRKAKVIKTVRTIAYIIGAIAFVVMGILVITDYYNIKLW